jgi:hypothetical protein
VQHPQPELPQRVGDQQAEREVHEPVVGVAVEAECVAQDVAAAKTTPFSSHQSAG